jgi:hypothetical protein
MQLFYLTNPFLKNCTRIFDVTNIIAGEERGFSLQQQTRGGAATGSDTTIRVTEERVCHHCRLTILGAAIAQNNGNRVFDIDDQVIPQEQFTFEKWNRGSVVFFHPRSTCPFARGNAKSKTSFASKAAFNEVYPVLIFTTIGRRFASGPCIVYTINTFNLFIFINVLITQLKSAVPHHEIDADTTNRAVIRGEAYTYRGFLSK